MADFDQPPADNSRFYPTFGDHRTSERVGVSANSRSRFRPQQSHQHGLFQLPVGMLCDGLERA
jgi:hypothetical protein